MILFTNISGLQFLQISLENGGTLLALFLFLVLIILFFAFLRKRSELSNEKNRTSGLENDKLKLEETLTKLNDELRMHERNSIRIQSDFKALNREYENFKSDQERQKVQFENLAQRVLVKEGQRLKSEQKDEMATILNPLKERIKEFESKVEKSQIASAERHQSLKEQLKMLAERSLQVSNDAQKLAQALQSDVKKQGNWGELILESILDKSGLEKGREYKVQETLKDEQGKQHRPDVIIYLPEGKNLIIDSKVSLKAYSKMVHAEETEEAKSWQKAHTKSIRNHIEGLALKKYDQVAGISAADFVLMFIPIDTAFSAALQLDPDLYHYAFEKNIVIVTSSTLLATLKTVETMWRNDRQNKNARKIALEAGKMYDKLVGFSETMTKLGDQINVVRNSYDTALKKLHTGRGNLIKKAQDIRRMGANTSKQLDRVFPDFDEEE